MWKFILAVFLVAVVRPGLGQQYVPIPASVPAALAQSAPVAQTLPATTARPTSIPAAAPFQSDSGSSNRYLSNADHLRIAAEHLKLAGCEEEAKRAWQMEREEYERCKNASILVQLQMIEVSLTKAAEVSSEQYGGKKGMSVLDLLTKLRLSGGSDNCQKSPDPKLFTLLESLPKNQLAVVRAEPSLMVHSGMPAHVLVGGEIGFRVKNVAGKETTEFKEYGTRAAVLATLLSDNKIHLNACLRVSELDPANTASAGEHTVPSFRTRESEMGVKLRSGQTMIIGGLIEDRDCAVNRPSTGKGDWLWASKVVHVVNKVETFLLVKATLATKDATDGPNGSASGTAMSSGGTARR